MTLDDLCMRLTKPLYTAADVEQLYRDRFLAASALYQLVEMLRRQSETALSNGERS